jgi:hypothetical protein
MNRGAGTDFHSSEQSSLGSFVEPVWKLCKSRLKLVEPAKL